MLIRLGFFVQDNQKSKKYARDRGHWNHLRIAKKHGFADHQDAIKKAGWVRYEHLHYSNHTPEDEPHYAGYTFRNDPESKAMVTKHLKKSGPFNRVVFDVHHKGALQTHEFKNSGEALRHLEHE